MYQQTLLHNALEQLINKLKTLKEGKWSIPDSTIPLGITLITLHTFEGYAYKTFIKYKLDHYLTHLLKQDKVKLSFDLILSLEEALSTVIVHKM